MALSTQKIVVWTIVVAIAAVVSTFVSGVAVYFVRKTLRETQDTTKASIASLNHAKDTTRRELRAYLTVIPDGINQLIGTKALMGHVLVRNVGKLPASNVIVTVRMFQSASIESDESERHSDFDFEGLKLVNADRTVQPGGEMRQGSVQRLPFGSIITAGHGIYVWGEVRYRDGYDTPRFTRFCHRYNTASRDRSYDPDGAMPDSSRIIIGADKARYHTYGNNAD